jgi:PAS domain S-box-containing protein
VAVNVPVELVEGQTKRSLLWLGIAAAAILLLTVGLASWFARVTATPIVIAAKAARQLAQRTPIPPFVSRIREANDLMAAMRRASEELSEAEEKQRQAAESLRESNARKTAVLESALDAIVAMDQEGRIVDFNPAAERIFGYRREDVVGKAVADTIVPERLRQSHWSGLHRFLETGRSDVIGRHLEMPALRANGTEFPAELAIVVASLEKGERFFTAYLRDITLRKRAEETEKTLVREIQHRSNNLLAVIQAIAHRTLSDDRSPAEARQAFDARLRALARINQQLTKSDWRGLKLREIVRQALEPFAARTVIEGADLVLEPQHAQNFSLALHELATNAAKYGALSNATGTVTLSWAVAKDATGSRLRFSWLETGGPPVTGPARQGFGTILLNVSFADVGFDYAPHGLRCEFEVLLTHDECAG